MSDASIRPTHFVDAGTGVVSVVELFQVQNTSDVLVRDGTASPPYVGILTRSSLQRVVLQGTPPDHLLVG